jgi:hypothetical protein
LLLCGPANTIAAGLGGNVVSLRGYNPKLALSRVLDIASALVTMELEQTGAGSKSTADFVCDGELVDTSLRVSDFPSWKGRKTVLYARWNMNA